METQGGSHLKLHSDIYSSEELFVMWEESSMGNCQHPPQCQHEEILQAAKWTLSLLSSENALLKKRNLKFKTLCQEKAFLEAQIKALNMDQV